jgi:inosine-uridine nucleoside N-ribohydrolase
MPGIKPASERAANFMIEQVHAHPHEVSIFAGGTLTNLALAVRLDPDFRSLAKELVFEGAFLNLGYADFNVRFDREAAHIVLTAPWPTITLVADVTGDVKFSGEDIDKIKENLHPEDAPKIDCDGLARTWIVASDQQRSDWLAAMPAEAQLFAPKPGQKPAQHFWRS